MKITPFAVEQWMNAHETGCRYNLAETCVESLTLAELLDMVDQRDSILDEIVSIAASVGAYILSDEVYRGTTQEGDTLTESVADLYPRGISTGSMSKTFSLAGLRLGWICGPAEVLRAAEVHRDYNTISVGILDDLFASVALENRDKILARSRSLVRKNLATLDRWMKSEDALSYVKPRGGTISLLHYSYDMPSREFCARLLNETGVLFTPGSAFEVEGCVRIGYANNHAILEEGLRHTSGFLRRLAS